MTEHATKFRVVGEYVGKNGERLTAPGEGQVRRLAMPYIVNHRPQQLGLVYETFAKRGSDHLLGFDDSRECRICNPVKGRLD